MNNDLHDLDVHLKELISELIKEYKNDTPKNQFKLAQLERRIWNIFTINQREKNKPIPRRENWFVDLTGCKSYKPGSRSYILNMGDSVQSIWDIIATKKMTLTTAYNLVKKSKGDQKLLQSLVDEYYSDKYDNYPTKDGYIHRRKKFEKVKSKKHEKNHKFFHLKELEDPKNAKMFYASIKSLTDNFIDIRFKDINIEPDLKKELVTNFEYEIRVIYEDLLRKIKNLRRDGASFNPISVTAIRNACEILNIISPKRKEKIDIKKARSVYKRLAARYHPDRNNGSDKLIKQYHAVNEAWEIVELWNEQMEG